MVIVELKDWRHPHDQLYHCYYYCYYYYYYYYHHRGSPMSCTVINSLPFTTPCRSSMWPKR